MPDAETSYVINGRYRFVRRLGEGGVGSVDLVADLADGDRPAALKRIDSTRLAPEAARILKVEFEAMSRLRHPNVVEVHDLGTDRATGDLFLTMEYVDGADLLTSMSGRGWLERLEALVQVCRGLEYIHARGLVHNDLKPQNVMVTAALGAADTGAGSRAASPAVPFTCKLCDFGLASVRGSGQDAIRGTARYLAPEVLAGQGPDRRSDLWALGVIAYEVLSGRAPFEGSGAEAIAAAMSRAPEPPSRWNSEIPPAVDALVLKLLARDPHARPESAAAVIEALGSAAGRTFDVDTPGTISSWVRSAPLAGRRMEAERLLAHLDAALAADATRPPRLAMIAGEMGIGKSRLVEHLRREAQVRGAAWAGAICYEGAASSFQPFLSILRQIAPETERDPALGSIFAAQETPERGDGGSFAAGADPEHARRLAIDAAASAILKAAARPTLVTIENLQWADTASLDLLEHLARNAASAPGLMLVTTQRSEGAAGGAAPVLDRIRSAASWDRIELTRLSPADVAAMVAGMFGLGAIPEALADTIVRETEGNPLFVQIAVESLVGESLSGSGAHTAGAGVISGLETLAGIPFPRSVTEAMERRLAPLPPDETRVLETLAVSETPIARDIVDEVLGQDDGGGAAANDAALEALVRRRLASRSIDPGGSLAIRIDHIRIREHVYETMDWARRSELHGRLARALETRGRAPLEELAHHFLNSSDCDKGLLYAERAGLRALSLFATERAVFFLERALELAPPDDAARRLRIQLSLAEARWLAGDPDRSLETAEKVIRGARAAGHKETALKASCHLVMVQAQTGRLEEAAQGLDRLIRTLALEGESPALAFCITTRANIEAMHGRMEESRRMNEEALAMRRRLGDRPGIGSNLNNLGAIDLMLGPTDRGKEILEENIALRTELSDLRKAADSMNNLGQWHRKRGDLAAAAACTTQAIETATRQRDRWSRATYLPNLVLLEHLTGRPDRAREAARRGLADARAMGHHQALCETLDHLGALERDLGDVAAALLAHEEALALARKHRLEGQEGYALASLALDRLEAPAGERDPAAIRDLVRKAARTADGSPRRAARVHIAGGRLALAENQSDAALAEARSALDAARSGGLVEMQAEAQMLAAECLLAAPDPQRLEEAAAAAEDAARLSDLSGAPDLQARSHLARADVAKARSRRADEREALARAVSLVETIAAGIEDHTVRAAWLARPQRAGVLRRAGETAGAALLRLAGDRPEGASRGALAAMYEIAEIISSMSDLDALLDRLLEVGLGIVGAERGLIILLDEKTGEQAIRAARDLEEETVEDALAYSRSVVREAASGRIVVALDTADDEKLRNFRSVSLYSIKSLMCVPMRVRDAIIGTVYVDSRRQGTPFTEQDLRFLEAFASLAASAIAQARLQERLTVENTHLRKEAGDRSRFHNIIGKTVKMQSVYDLIEKIGASTLPVLIEGESGTGKELVAKALHYIGPRRRRPFYSENVAAIPDTLLESEMFGHMRGAFTGAEQDRKGLFEMADGGTLFLDEVGDMSLPMQAKLLRALQEGEIRPIGGKQLVKVDVRVVSATNRNLAEMIRQGKFREDLYYRLNVVRIPLPPLRERKEDIPLLVEYFLEKATPSGEAPRKIEIGALQLLLRYSWPGNVRELENEIRRLAVLSSGSVITQQDIVEQGELFEKITRIDEEESGLTMEEMEKKQIQRALLENKGNRADAARALGISRATIFRKMRRFGLTD